MKKLRGANFCIVLPILVLLPCLDAMASSWFDNFNDGSIIDGSPFTWTFNEAGATPGTHDPSSGDLVLSAPGDPMPIIPTDPTDNTLAVSVSIGFGDTYARTQATTIPDDPENEARGNVGILTRWNPSTLSGYVTLMDHGDELEIYRIDGGAPIPLLIQGDIGVNTLTDAVMEVEMVGAELSVYLWQATETKPAAPTATATDSTYAVGSVGLFFNEDSDGHFGVFRYAMAQDFPILPPDFDGNGVVNHADLTQWIGDYATNGASDADFDSDSDGNDFLLWQRTLVAGMVMTEFLAVPEASILSLLLAAAVCPVRWR